MLAMALLNELKFSHTFSKLYYGRNSRIRQWTFDCQDVNIRTFENLRWIGNRIWFCKGTCISVMGMQLKLLKDSIL